MNANLHVEPSRRQASHLKSAPATSSRRGTTELFSGTPTAEVTEAVRLIEPQRSSSPNGGPLTDTPVSSNGKNSHSGPEQTSHPNRRQIAFRCVRLTLAGGLVSAAALYARSVITTVRSTEAWFNAEITALRAPIAGEVRIEGVVLGQPMRKGQTLFTIENSRFGNEQVMSQMNWISDLADRLKAESQEAEIRYEKQAEITRLHEKMFADQVLPRLDLLEQQNTLALYGAVMTNKFVLAKKAAGRVEELSRQVELQRSATIQMPFDGAAWSMPAREGGQVAAHEKVIEVIDARRVWVDAFFHERHGAKLSVGREVQVQTEEGKLLGRGIIESIRGGVGRIPLEGALAVLPNEFRRNRVAVHVRLESEAPFNAGQFFGVGRSVVVTLGTHE